MVKTMHVVKGQGHIVGSTTNWFILFSFQTNHHCHSWDTAILKFDLENQIQVQCHDIGQN